MAATGNPTCQREGLRQEAAGLPLSPEAQDASRLFYASQTQWRVGFAGPTGLDYLAVEVVARALDVSTETLPWLQIMESEQLQIWEEARKKEDK